MMIGFIVLYSLVLLGGVRAGSVCSGCVSFGAVWPQPCYESGLALAGNNIKTVQAHSAEKCQVNIFYHQLMFYNERCPV
jgi:hypothetical protein